MSIWETVLIYVVIPLFVILVVYALGLSSKRYRIPRYRPGQRWNYQPVWWSANAAGPGDGRRSGRGAGAGLTGAEGEEPIRTASGGARGSW